MRSGKAELEALLAGRGWGATLARGGGAEGEPRDASGLRLRVGTVTELVAAGAGVTSLGMRLVAAAGGKVAWIDPGDRLDPEAAARAGIALARLLWVRGGTAETALRAAQLVVQAGSFAVAVLDLLDVPEAELRIPRSAWFRLLRGLEHGQQTALLVLGPRALAGTCASQVVRVGYAAPRWDMRARPLLAGAGVAVERTARREAGEKLGPGPAASSREEFAA